MIIKKFMKHNYLIFILLLVNNFGFANIIKAVLPPTATISGTTTVCQNATGVVITFIGTSGIGNYTFTYTINGVSQTPVSTSGNNNSVTVPVVTNVAGTFTYTLVSVQDNIGTQNINNQNAIVTVISGFSVNAGTDIKVCKGNPINLTSSVIGNGSNPVLYSWNGPNGFSSNQQSPTRNNSTVLMSGNYIVTASIGNCQVQDVVNVEVLNVGVTNPSTLNACLTTGQTSAQVGLILSLPTSASLIQTITINWGDLSTPQLIPQSNWTTPIFHTYPAGSYTVTITSTTTLGCTVTQNYIAFIGSSPQAATLSLFANQAAGCSPHTTNFTLSIPISNSDGTNYLICFGDNTSSCITYVDGAPIPPGWVFSGTAAGFNLYTITHVYSITSCGNSVNLNGTTYNDVFLPSVITTNPCTQPQPQAGSLISVGIAPTASFTPNPIPNTCINTPITLNNTSNFGGIIDLTTNSCTTTSPFYWTIAPSTAGLWTASGLGSNNNFPSNELFWTSGSMTPSITFNQPGNYTITLNVKNSCGINSVSHTVCVEPPLTPQFTLNTDTGCIPLSVTAINNTSLINQCATPTYLWQVTHTPLYCATSTVTIPNQTTPNANFNFTEPGTYLIRLTVTNSCGTFNTTQTVTVKKPPTVSISPISNSCGTASINPTATVNSCAPTGSTLTYAWSFPGGTPSTANTANPGTINYPAGGPYTVSLVVSNECGASNTATQTFTVNTAPTITNTSLNQTICSGSSTSLVTLTATPAGTTFSWTATATAGITGFLPSGTNTIPVQTITTTNTSPGTVTYTIIPSTGVGIDSCVGPSVAYVINVNPAPSITTQPASSTVCQGGVPTVLSVTLSGVTGTPQYQWYSNVSPSNLGGTLIPGATNATYNPPSTTVGVFYYYCVITLPTGGCSNITSNFATVTISPLPTVTSQPTLSQNLCVGVTIPTPLSVSYAGGIGAATYQWYSNTSNATTGGTLIPGATSSTYTPPVYLISGVYYYYVVITLSGNGCGSTTSNSAQINVFDDPTVTTQPLTTQTLCQGATPIALQVVVSGGNGPFSYQWFSNLSNNTTTGSAIATATSASFIPPTIAVGTIYYYCIISQSATPGCSVTSATGQVIINAAPTIQNQPVSSTICLGGTPTVLSVTYINGVGSPSYQWYSNTINANISGTLISGATNSTYSPPNSPVGTVYYYCVISLPSGGGCSNISSNTATITINAGASITLQPTPTQSLCVGTTVSTPLIITYTGGTGTASYQWYSNSLPSNSGGTLIPGATNASYTPSIFTIVGTYYYYAIVTLSGNGCGPIPSDVAEIIVVADPLVTAQPLLSQTVCQTATAASLTVSVSGGISAPYSYQWYSNVANNTTSGFIVSGATNNTFTPPTANVGTLYYYCIITQTTVSGCNVTSNIGAVIVNLAPTFTSQPASSTICLGGTPTVLSVTYVNGVGTPSYQWYSNTTNSNSGGILIAGATNATFSPPNSAVGTIYYYCIISLPSTGGCSSIISNTADVTINAQATITLQPTPTQSLCVGATIATPLSITYSGGTGNASYQWYSNTASSNSGGTLIPGATSASYTPLVFTTVGTYYYYAVVTLSGNGCGPIPSDVAEIIIVTDPIIITEPLASQTVCQNSPATILSVIASGGIGNSYSYQWYSSTANNTTLGTILTGETNSTFAPPTSNAGTLYYYCIIMQPNGIGCNVTSAIATVIVNVAPAIVNQPQSSIICLGATPTTLSLTFTNGAGTPSYQWYSNSTNLNIGGTLILGATSATYNPPAISSGTTYYYCVVTFSSITGSCSIITTNAAEVIINPIPVVANETTTICSSTSFTITPTNTSGNIVPTGTTYTWSNPTISPAGSITGASTQAIPQSQITQTLVNTTTSPSTVTYTVTPTSGVCVGNDFTVTVTVNPAINPNIVANNNTCFGVNSASITTNITGGIPPYIITWSGPNSFTSSATSITNLLPGVYNVTIDDVGGCPFSNSYTITEPSDIVITVDSENDITCFGSANGNVNLSISGGTGNYFYTWTNNGNPFSTNEDISSLAPGTYIVSVTDANSCGPKTATFTITQPPILEVSLVSQTNILCFGDATGAIVINVVGGTPNPTTLNYSYAWTGPNGFTSINQNLIAILAGTYNLTVTDNNNCSRNLIVTITQSSDIIIAYTTTPITCYGANNASITTSLSGGNPPYQFQWSNLATSLNQTNLSAGNYTITVTDNFGCQKVQNINIPEAPIFTVNPIVRNISCFGAQNGSINLNLTGGIPPVALVWSDGSTAGLTRNNLGPGTYTATISDGTPCFIVRTFTILEPQLLVVSANVTNALNCTNTNSGAINLQVSGGTPPFSYSWSNGATTEDLNAITAGNYLVTVTDANGCSRVEQFAIVRPAPIQIGVTTQTDFDCANHEVTQNYVALASGGVPPHQYQWSSGTISGNNNQNMQTDVEGTVILTVTDNIGCQATYTVVVDIPELGYAGFDQTSIGYTTYGIYSIGDPIQFQSTITGDYISVSWDFGDGTFSTELNPVHTYVNPRDYVVTQTVTYPFGCVYVQTISLIIEKGYLLVVPTAFTPNNDSLNDTYRPVTKALKNVKLDIYDTWGSLIYTETGDVLVGWDGKLRGFNAENGNYYSKVSAETFYGTIVNENQTFTLIK
jgi:gliding motility-associated-like protein